MRPILLVTLGIALTHASLSAAPVKRNAARPAPRLTAADILRRTDAQRGPDGEFSFFVRVTDYDAKTALREHVYQVFSKGGKRALIETKEPMRLTGRKLLLRDNDLWLYLPSVKRPTRVSMQQRLTGEVSNGDIARTSFSEDYDAKALKAASLDGKKFLRLDLKAKHDDAPYRKIRLWVEPKTYRPYKAQFFALSGKLLKTSEYPTFEPVFGEARATEVLIRDAVRPQRYSHLKYYGYRRETLDESFFNKESLP